MPVSARISSSSLASRSIFRKSGHPHHNHAIVERETSFTSAWVETEEATRFLQRACPWALPTERPAFAQGAVAEIPVKLWFEEASVRFVVPAAYAADLEERMT